MKEVIKRSWPHLLAIVIFLVIGFSYMYPVLEGKILNQTDVTKAKGMQGEISEYYEETGNYTLWTNSMFGGMPAYQINMSHVPSHNIYQQINRFISKIFPRHSIDVWFLYCVGFYILLIALGVSPWLAIVGSIAFALSSYNLIYLEAGHITKTQAIAMMAPSLAGIILLFRHKYFAGFLVFSLFLGMQIAYNHLQITYYLLLMILAYGIYQLILTIGNKQWKQFIIATSLAMIALLFAVGPNLTNILTTYEYSHHSMRGGSDLAEYEETQTQTSKTGLDESYAFAWSYGVAETFTILVPDFHGGASIGKLPENSKLYDALRQNNVSDAQARQFTEQSYTYWGNKSFTSGPFYFGAVVCFLFLFGFFIIKHRIKWWILGISVVAIFWSWGENFTTWNHLFFNYFPMFNKFRVPETFLVIPSLTFPLMAVLTIRELLKKETYTKDLIKALYRSLLILGGLLLFIYLFAGSLFDFVSLADSQLGSMPPWFLDALREDRMQLLRNDILRSLVFILLGGGATWLLMKNKLKANYFVVVIGVLILFDLWGVDRRYLNEDDFVAKRKAAEILPTQADLQILQDPDPDFRVFNLTQSPFQESRTSYYHHSLGGYHGAKLARYQDIIEHHLSRQNMDVINMLNTKYLIVPGQDQQPVARRNPDALGNAWFVNRIRTVENPKEEIDALQNFDPSKEAIVDESIDKFGNYLSGITLPDSVAPGSEIQLTNYKPDELTYKVASSSGGFVVFSEIYYNGKNGWQAFLDGEPVGHIRVNYILRGMAVPAGTHELRFSFEPEIFYTGQRASLVSSILIGLLLLAGLVLQLTRNTAFTRKLTGRSEPPVTE